MKRIALLFLLIGAPYSAESFCTVAPAMVPTEIDIPVHITSWHIAQPGFESSGKVAEVLVREGDSVKRGELLALLDPEFVDLELKRVKAKLKALEADLKLQRLKRRNREQNQQAYSEEVLAEQRAQTQMSLATLQSMEAQIQSLEEKRNRMQLRASYAGSVIARLIESGDAISAHTPAFEIHSQDPLQLQMQIEPRLAAKLPDPLHPVACGSKAEAVDKKVPGTLNERTGMQTVLYKLQNANQNCKAGLNTEWPVTLELTQIRIPMQCLSPHPRGYLARLKQGEHTQTLLIQGMIIEDHLIPSNWHTDKPVQFLKP